jgi:hypothetical protein
MQKSASTSQMFSSGGDTRRIELSPMRDTMAHLNLMSWTNRHKKLYPPSDDPIGDWRVLVKGIHPACSEKHLHKICAKFGQVIGIDMPTGKAMPATVHFNRREDAEECVRLVDGRFIGGWVVHLSVVNPLRDRGRPVRMWPPQWQYRRDLPGVVPPP